MEIKKNWTLEEVEKLYHQPFLELLFQATTLHRQFHDAREMQLCHIINIKNGGCPENCKYCPQSAHHQRVDSTKLMEIEEVLRRVREVKKQGITRVCLGAAWREPRESPQFERVLEMIRQVREEGVEVCVTLGMLNESQAKRLKEAGLYSYNHNIDTSEAFYPQVITTRTFQERLDTLDQVEKAGLNICCGGILGMGESLEDRFSFLMTLANRNKQPDSVPINILQVVPGLPLEGQKPPTPDEFLRIIALARIMLPKAMVRLSAGRVHLNRETVLLALLAGANSMHVGGKLLTMKNPELDEDHALFQALGLKPRPSYKEETCCAC